MKIESRSFDHSFYWGVSIAAAQNEGAYLEGGKGLSIWDVFANKAGRIKGGQRPSVASDFYHHYKDDLLMAKALGFNAFRFSISWARVLPDGTGRVNKEGVEFYNKVIDECLKLGLEPFVTIYHWDLPYELEKEAGWTSPLMQKWFSRFARVCAENFGGRVKHWIIINEPLSFTALGYMLGMHAPGRKGLSNFIPAIHNATLAQAEGGRIIRSLVKQAKIGTSYSCSEIIPYRQSRADIEAANRIDVLMNRLFIEPALGMGYPYDDHFPFLQRLHMETKAWRYKEKMKFDFDFIGLQNYFPVVVKYNRLVPVVQASEVKAPLRKVPHTAMKWEINPESLYRVLKRFAAYDHSRKIIITENGAAFKDVLINGSVHDEDRQQYFENHLKYVLKAKEEGVNIGGYFAWTLTDNFEWSEGYQARFGLIYVDFKTQHRVIKDSGHWWRAFLQS